MSWAATNYISIILSHLLGQVYLVPYVVMDTTTSEVGIRPINLNTFHPQISMYVVENSRGSGLISFPQCFCFDLCCPLDLFFLTTYLSTNCFCPRQNNNLASFCKESHRTPMILRSPSNASTENFRILYVILFDTRWLYPKFDDSSDCSLYRFWCWHLVQIELRIVCNKLDSYLRFHWLQGNLHVIFISKQDLETINKDFLSKTQL